MTTKPALKKILRRILDTGRPPAPKRPKESLNKMKSELNKKEKKIEKVALEK